MVTRYFQRPVLNSTRARQGRLGRDVFWVLLFSTALADATTKATASSSSANNVSTSTKVPKGEKTEHVSGHSYDEVIAGPRDGMFINRSGNRRDGQAFAMVKRDATARARTA